MGLTAILNLLATVNALLPEVIKLLTAVETAFPNATVDAKIAEVIKVLQGFSTVENDLTSPISAIGGLIGALHSASTAAKPAA